jgi:hypothetical protein
MAIGENRFDELLGRAKMLKEAQAWKQSFDNATKQQMIDWIQKDQLTDKGVDGKGVVIGNYSFATEVITKGRKQQGDHYTLNDTGAFYESMRVEVETSLIWITGDGQKGKDNLYQKYGDDITTLTDENLSKLKDIVATKYQDYIRKILQID